MSSYRQYYWDQAKKQLWLFFKIVWHGVIRNEGHHSGWGKGWFYGKKK